MNERVIKVIEYETRYGDSFDQLALEFYNNEKLAHLIMDFNPDYADVIIFDSNIALQIPIYEESQSVESLPRWQR